MQKQCLPRTSVVLAIILGCLLPMPASVGFSQAQQASFGLAPETARDLQELFRFTGHSLPLVSAHRGGAGKGMPENCIATFEATLATTYSMLEIDPRVTRDGHVVVVHDATLQRTTSGQGAIAEHTLEELRKLRLKDSVGQETAHTIPTLDEVIEWARGRTILVLDQKDLSVLERVSKIEEHRAESYVMLIVSSLSDAQACYAANPNVMMEFMIPDREKFHQFDRSGVPWKNIIAFVGHKPPSDKGLLQMIHDKGAMCMAGTSRHLDLRLAALPASDTASIQQEYLSMLEFGVDILETDLPREVGPLLYHSGNREPNVPSDKSKYFKKLE